MTDNLYAYNEEKLSMIQNKKLWMNDPKYFKKVKISPSASIKMMMHGQQGVEKGIKQNGKPVEVMGLLLGRPDTEDLNSLIISDAQALPIEGFETKVVADDENVVNYMIELGDALEVSRKERFCGWYHTHPFDLDTNGHCFLSNTDVTTQLQWQRSEDPHGNPWLAIVIDPLYSLSKNKPEMMAFRVYPTDYNANLNETPDGSILADDRRRVERWGSCWNRYYVLEIEYFMSALSQKTLSILKNKFLWHTSFVDNSTKEDGYYNKISSDIKKQIDRLDSSNSIRSMQIEATSSIHEHSINSNNFVWNEDCITGKISIGAKLTHNLGIEQCNCLCAQVAKIDLFGKYCAIKNENRHKQFNKQS